MHMAILLMINLYIVILFTYHFQGCQSSNIKEIIMFFLCHLQAVTDRLMKISLSH